ncbi:hypothetical protein P691DRAFT_495243 [Macrolepiota fuliginosa MF-IS2]|uniref:Uncharacterized protein n=1 Tax=Macrolepiota fuliginosa MF-IS2 TaxID=1400762 RepID=A0A9P5X0M5_9AGAR|nr:hypothetical protein P691DRAFT_495243 [Macrolepiota fuliginosa MF-IS2]
MGHLDIQPHVYIDMTDLLYSISRCNYLLSPSFSGRSTQFVALPATCHRQAIRRCHRYQLPTHIARKAKYSACPSTARIPHTTLARSSFPFTSVIAQVSCGLHPPVNTSYTNLSIPPTTMIRIFFAIQKAPPYTKMFEGTGARIPICHGRIHEQCGINTDFAGWTR